MIYDCFLGGRAGTKNPSNVPKVTHVKFQNQKISFERQKAQQVLSLDKGFVCVDSETRNFVCYVSSILSAFLHRNGCSFN
jgi:hypothetical protein